MEEWRDIEGYEGLYQVSNLGRVRSLNFNHTIGKVKELSLRNSKKGYKQVILYKDGKTKSYRVHRLVAEAFIENPNNYEQINHKNEIKSDNTVNNLEWCTNEYNHNYGTRNEKVKKSLSKKTLCITTGEVFNSMKEASTKYGISNGSISECCNNKRNSAGTLPTGEKLKWMYVEED